jgi:photosystem II stability/assembly factor-like uncharacterized protein
MKNKVLLGSALMLAAGVSFFSVEWNSANSSGYTPRESETKVRPDIEERINGGREIFKRLRATPNGEVDGDIIAEVKGKVKRQLAKRSSLGLDWGFMGPANRGGRTRTLVIDNQDNNRLYTGGVAGGLFISTNAGTSWEVYDDALENLMISTIAQGPDGTIYVGTGGDFGGSSDDIPGAGMYKSTDRGETFVKLDNTDPSVGGVQWRTVNRVAVNPSNSQQVLAGTGRGLFLSIDGGENWNPAILVDANCTIQGTSEIEDIEWSKDQGYVLVGYNGGVYRSETPLDPCSYEQVTDGIPLGSGRIDITFCQEDEDVAYAIQVTSGGQLSGVYESNDGGETWFNFSPAPPTSVIDPNFNLFGDNGQGVYDLAIEVAPNNCEMIYVAGVQTYRIDGSWTRIAENFADENSGLYVHSDKHYFVFDTALNSNRMYITSDGGIGRTDNAQSEQPDFFTYNRDYGTTQFYGIAVSSQGQIIGGTQDNGTWLIDPRTPGISQRDGLSIRGGDGFDCDVSDLFPFAFATSQFGSVGRYDGVTNSNVEFVRPANGPFWSIIKLWESDNDLTSKDSIGFDNDTTSFILKAEGGTNTIDGTVVDPQPAAEFVDTFVQFRSVTNGIEQTAHDIIGNGILVDADAGTNDSIGFFNYTTGDYSVTFPVAPAAQSNIEVTYMTTFEAGDTLRIASNTQDRFFDYILPAPLAVGDSITIQDPVQSLFATATNNGTYITREALRNGPQSINQWIALPGSEVATSFEFSPDGNHLYVGTAAFSSGSVVRYSGLNDAYADAGSVTRTIIFSTSSGSLTGIDLNPADPEKLLVTVGGYGHSQHIVELQNAQSAAATALRVVKEGDLPGMPIFDAEYHILDPKIVLIGTDFGVWSTSNIDDANVTWANENASLSNTPVFDIVQQELPFGDASNHEVFYAGTHGRGIWSTASLINSTDDKFASFEDKVDLGLAMYPNPVNGEGRVNFDLAQQSTVDIQVFDLNGRVVKQFLNQSYEAGENTFAFNTSSLSAGTYMLSVKTNTEYSTSKFVVVK